MSKSPMELKAGETEPSLNKKIKEVIIASPEYIVYLDDNLEIQWSITSDEHEEPNHFGHVLNRVSLLEAKCHFIDDNKTLAKMKRNIAEGLVRAIEGSEQKLSDDILDSVALDISDRNREKAWMWYYCSAIFVTTVAAVLFIVGWHNREFLISYYGVNSFQITLGTFLGAAGALLSTLTRSNRIVTDANAGMFLHILEGASRVVAGLIGALLIALGIKAGLLFGAIEIQGSEFAALLVFCLIAGASERFIPSLITKVERETG